MYDIFYISKEKDNRYYDLKKRFPLLKFAGYTEKGEGFFVAQKKSLSKFFWVINEGFDIDEKFEFTYEVPEWDKKYVHIFKQENGLHGGLYLIPKDYHITQKEAEYNFFVSKKDIDIVFGSYPPYERFIIRKPEDYFEAQKKSKTSMFYAILEDFFVEEDFSFSVPEWDKKYVHVFKRQDGIYGGVFLIPREYRITQKEAEFDFFVNKKEIDLIASKINYDRFIIEKPQDYFEFQKKCNTSMFYAIDKDYSYVNDFKFDLFIKDYDKKYVHVFLTSTGEYDKVHLIPRDYTITKNEANHSFFINKKEHDIVASKLKFDIVFISYNEPNADNNYEKLLRRFPYAKRIHGIKGIHQAHIEAAKISKTRMFWVVDGDAIIEENFDFYLEVPKWDRDAVHVFKSRNPINDLIYGYGGVKLLPTELVLKMDTTSVDMTTSISKKFISMDLISNVTAFNTDPFNTWKSAFRECVKLSSKIIDGQVDEQTQYRLNVWCTIGIDKPFGDYAIKGALMGSQFGKKNLENKEILLKINDWKWLQDEFKKC